MGEIIRKTAAASDIFGDLRTTLTKARARGGAFASLAETQLVPILTLVETMTAELDSVAKATAPLVAAVEAEDSRADEMLGRISDEVWNTVGRPASDPMFQVLFPGGIAYYADGSTAEQADRMELLAELLEKMGHPRLPVAVAKEKAAEIRAEAVKYRATYESARAPLARLWLLERMQTALAKSAHAQLSTLKRKYKAEGLLEPEIHEVIPAHVRGRPGGKGDAKAAGEVVPADGKADGHVTVEAGSVKKAAEAGEHSG